MPAPTAIPLEPTQATVDPQVAEAAQTSASPRAKLAVLVYLCGDNHISAETDKYLEAMLAATPLEHVHLIIQHDKPDEAKRYVVRAGTTQIDRSENVRRDVNTGAPEALAEFLEWGLRIKDAVADHYALIFSGLGINARYVRQSLPLETLPKALRQARGGKPEDPNDEEVIGKFVERFLHLSKADKASYREAIHNRSFTICHDFSNSGSLQISDLRNVLADATKWFAESKSDARFDLVFFHMGATAFVEVLFELEGLAQVFLGSSDRLPDEGLPFDAIFSGWNEALAKVMLGRRARQKNAEPVSKLLAKNCLQTLSTASKTEYYQEVMAAMAAKDPNFKPDYKAIQESLDKIVAVNIDALDELARSLDALAIALLHSLGDWHVKDALERAQQSKNLEKISDDKRIRRRRKDSNRIASDEPGKPTAVNKELEEIEFLPAVDLFAWLDRLEEEFALKLGSDSGESAAPDATPVAVPQSHGQRDRIRKLYKLIRKTIAHLHSSKLSRSEWMPGHLFIDHDGQGSYSGLLVVMPPLRTPEEIQEDRRIYSVAMPSYSQLNFSRRVHWSALVGTYQMIREKPHALWRVISSMLVDASSPARDAVLNRLISRQSVISQMRGQFRSLGESESLSLSFDQLETNDPATDLARFQVRLEPSLGGSIIFQHESRIYRSSLDSIWQDLTSLMNLNRPYQELVQRLRSLGASLGEDVIQDLVGALELARQSMVDGRNETPHLTLQLPREFMRFPWELMNDREGLLSERYALGRQVFMESRFTRSIVRHQANTIRVLVVGDPVPASNFKIFGSDWTPEPLLGARVEAKTIIESFQRMNDEMAGIVEFEITEIVGQPITRDDMRRYLREGNFDIIHFAGHALNNATDGDGSGWVVSDGLLHAREIRNTLAWSKRPPWLIFANACEAGMDISSRKEQPDVSGLATACIGNGVAAYIAPLWPVDDEIARWLAVGFYRELLRERYTVGESLCRARVSIWNMLKDAGSATVMPARTALTWASFVLYGDPTSRLLNTLWNPTRQQTDAPAPAPLTRKAAVRTTAARFRSATTGQLCSAVEIPPTLQFTKADLRLGLSRAAKAQDTLAARGVIELQLVEREGLRYWRSLTKNSSDPPTTFSKLGRLLNDRGRRKAELRKKLGARVGQDRGVLDAITPVKKWLIDKVAGVPTQSLVEDIVAEFDRQLITDERLIRYVTAKEYRTVLINDRSHRADRSNQIDDGEWLVREVGTGQLDRALLILHDTVSHSSHLLEDFATRVAHGLGESPEDETLLNWMFRRYRAVMAYDHWTLSKSPERNAEDLIKLMPKICRNSLGQKVPLELDVICHGRGGLVARVLAELADRDFNINRVVFVGTPHAGTGLAIPGRWGSMADLLVNQISQDPNGVLCRLSSFFAYMSAQRIRMSIPGLSDMCPLKADAASADPKPLLERLRQVSPEMAKRYFVVASNYTPTRDSLSLQAILSEVESKLVDKVFDEANDLLVDTASMWALDQRPNWLGAPTAMPAENILLFNTDVEGPREIVSEQRAGVHHLNYFTHWRVRDFIRHTLEKNSP